MIVDYLILGQGICGSFLSYYLQKEGKTFLVIDAPQPFTASKVASGVINPVTGRRIVKTWLIDELLPFTWNAYKELGKYLQIDIIKQCNVLDFHATPQMKEAFEQRLTEDANYLKIPAESQWQQYFRYNYGIGEINPCWLADIQMLLKKWREHLIKHSLLWEENFDSQQCKISEDAVTYKDINAHKIICCEGAAGANNPYFKLLPFALNKGEALIAQIPDLPQTNIYKQGISIVPWQGENLFWIGATHEWNYTDLQPSALYKKKVQTQLDYWLKLPYTIVNHIASERPANIERRPFVGLHPLHKSVGILNGMGTKGCSLAPYFAHQLAQHLVNGAAIEPLANVQRFMRVLSR